MKNNVGTIEISDEEFKDENVTIHLKLSDYKKLKERATDAETTLNRLEYFIEMYEADDFIRDEIENYFKRKRNG